MSTSVLQTHHHRLHAQSLQAGESPRLQEVSLSLLQNTLACTSMNITRALILHSSNLAESHCAHHTGALSFLCLVTGKAGTTPSPEAIFHTCFAQVDDLLRGTEEYRIRPFCSAPSFSPHTYVFCKILTVYTVLERVWMASSPSISRKCCVQATTPQSLAPGN